MCLRTKFGFELDWKPWRQCQHTSNKICNLCTDIFKHLKKNVTLSPLWHKAVMMLFLTFPLPWLLFVAPFNTALHHFHRKKPPRHFYSSLVPTQSFQKGCFHLLSSPTFLKLLGDKNSQSFHWLASLTFELCAGPALSSVVQCNAESSLILPAQNYLHFTESAVVTFLFPVLFFFPAYSPVCVNVSIWALFMMFVVQFSAGVPDGISKSLDWCSVSLN